MTKNNSLNKTAAKQSIKNSNNQVKQAEKIDLKNKTRMLLASPFYKSKFQVKYTSESSENSTGKYLTIKQYPEGFTAFEESATPENEGYGSHWMKYAGRELSVYNPLPMYDQPDEFASSKTRKRTTRKNLEAWKILFGQEGNIESTSESYGIKSLLDNDVSLLSTKESRYEQYMPIAFTQNGQVTGGSYMYLGQTGQNEELKTVRPSIQTSKVKEFFIGSCMFGATLYGRDQHGEKHPLTNQLYEIPEECVIQSIDKHDYLHPDEYLTQKAFNNHIPLMKTLSDECVSINYHLPLPNYIMYGLNYYLNGTLTKEAFAQYVSTIKERANIHRNFLQDTCAEHGIAIRISSTIDCLGLADSANDMVLENLLETIGLENDFEGNKETIDRVAFCDKIVAASINYLSKQEGEVGSVWSIAKQQMDQNEFSLNKSSHDILHQLNYIDYSANLAISARRFEDREVCSLLPSMEVPVQVLYKRMFSSDFSSIITLNWLPPILIHMEQYRNRIFNLEDYIAQINSLINEGLFEQSYLQTASIAVDSPELAAETALNINAILTRHEMGVHLRSSAEQNERRFVS